MLPQDGVIVTRVPAIGPKLVPVMFIVVPGEPLLELSVIEGGGTSAMAGVTGIAAAISPRTQAAENILKNLLILTNTS
jgi:hypothetical protein